MTANDKLKLQSEREAFPDVYPLGQNHLRIHPYSPIRYRVRFFNTFFLIQITVENIFFALNAAWYFF